MIMMMMMMITIIISDERAFQYDGFKKFNHLKPEATAGHSAG